MERESCEALFEQMQTVLLSGSFDEALVVGSFLELAIAEREHFDHKSNFYDLYMTLFLLTGDLIGARYLYRRATEEGLDSSAHMEDLWLIVKFLWANNLENALLKIKGTLWSPELSFVIDQLMATLISNKWAQISKSYVSLALEHLGSSLCASQDEVFQEISRRHWIIDTDGIHIHPKPAESQRTCMLDSLKENLDMIHELSSQVAHLETKSLHVDLSGKVEGAVGAATKRHA